MYLLILGVPELTLGAQETTSWGQKMSLLAVC